MLPGAWQPLSCRERLRPLQGWEASIRPDFMPEPAGRCRTFDRAALYDGKGALWEPTGVASSWLSPPSRPEARSRFGFQSASELGAPVASSIPEQLPGHEPASARKGHEDGSALVWRYRCVEGSFGRHALARGAILFGE